MTAFFIYSLTGGGAERVVSLLANEIALSEKVMIITISSQPSHYRLQKNVIHQSLIDRGKSTILLLRLINNIWYLLGLIKILRGYNVTRLISFMPSANLLGIVAANLCSTHVTISERSDPRVYTYGIRGTIRKYLYEYAHRLVVQNEQIRDYYSAYMPSSKIEVIPNPVNLEVPVSQKKNIILSVGRLDENKNQRLIIEAFAIIKSKDWRLVICGDGKTKSKLESLISELNLTESIELPGEVANIEEYYAEAKIFAFASRSEGFPNVLLEAMSHGCACVTTECISGGHELLEHNNTCLLVPSWETEKFSQHLNKLVSSEDLRKKLRDKSKLKIKEYSTSEIVKRWIV